MKGRLRVHVPVSRFRKCGLLGILCDPGRSIAEAVIQTEFDEVDVGIDIDAGHSERAQIDHPARQRDVVVFGLGTPVAADGEFDAGARGPAGLVLSGRRDDVAVAVIDVDVAVPPGKAAGHIRQQSSERISDAAARGADIIDRRVEGRRRQSRGVQRAGERRIRLYAEHEMVRQLPVIAGLIAADQAGDAVRKEHALLGEGIGAGAETAAAITDMAAQVKSGPVVNGLESRRLERQVRCQCRAIAGEQAQAQTREYALPGSAAAAHRVGAFSANIPAVSLVISADLPARCHPGNDPVRPELRITAHPSQIGPRPNSFPIVIASHSQLQERTRKSPFHDIA